MYEGGCVQVSDVFRWLMFWHTDITDNTEIKPSQMAEFYVGRLKARNSCVPPVASGKAERYKNLIQNYSEVLQDIGFFLKKAA